MRDAELRAALEGTATTADPTFRLRVLQRICERARRRAMAERTAVWIAASIGIGLAAQMLTPPEAGVPSVEAIAMTASIGIAALLLATLAAAGTNRATHWAQRLLSRASR